MQLTETLPGIHWEAAQAAARAAVAKAESLAIRINVALVDRAGLPMAFLRMSGAPLHSISIAEDKAYTAASFGLSTGGWETVLGDNFELRQGLAGRDRLVMFGGGLPVMVDGTCVGGIGVSGGSEAQDEICARAGLAALG